MCNTLFFPFPVCFTISKHDDSYFPSVSLSVSYQVFFFQNCHPPPTRSISSVFSTCCEWGLPQLHLCSVKESCSESLFTFHKPYLSANGALIQHAIEPRELAFWFLTLLLMESDAASMSYAIWEYIIRKYSVFSSETPHHLVSHLQHQGRERSAARAAHHSSVEYPQTFPLFSQSS